MFLKIYVSKVHFCFTRRQLNNLCDAAIFETRALKKTIQLPSNIRRFHQIFLLRSVPDAFIYSPFSDETPLSSSIMSPIVFSPHGITSLSAFTYCRKENLIPYFLVFML